MFLLLLFLCKIFLSILELTILLLLAVAFITLFERKLLAAYQRRVGPNVVGIFGLVQPIADGAKLIFKEVTSVIGASKDIFTLSPVIALLFADLLWFIITFSYENIFIQYMFSLIFIFIVLSANALPFILGGWASNSRYAFLGSLRTAAQMISYEVMLALNLLPIILFVGDLSILEIELAQEHCWFVFIFFPLFLLHFISTSAETARIPFDLPEAEGELVAGYIVEYAAVEFAFFFIAEYTNILSSSVLMAQLFFGGSLAITAFSIIPTGIFWLFTKTFIIFFIILSARALLPRLRYDQLMRFCWFTGLPLTIIFLLFYFLFFIFIF